MEMQMIFGAAPSVANFDQLSNTLVEIAAVLSAVPRGLISRTLDDIMVVAPEGTRIAEKYGDCFKSICKKKTNVLLAENCPLSKKAFKMQKRGVVLGVGFDSTRQEWFLTREKAEKIKNRILPFLGNSHTNLKEIQKIMGTVNNLALICPFLKFYKFAGNQLLGKFAGNEDLVLPIPNLVKEDLVVCVKVAPARLPLQLSTFFLMQLVPNSLFIEGTESTRTKKTIGG
jgi:hypothetical protein